MFLLLALFGLCLAAGPAAAAEEPPYQRRAPRGLIRNSRLSRAGSGRSDGARRSKFGRVQRFQNIGRLHFRRQCAQAEHRNDGAGDRIARRGDRWADGPVLGAARVGHQFRHAARLSLEALPKPNDKAVTLRQSRPTRFAVVRFSGHAEDDSIAAKTAELKAFVAPKASTQSDRRPSPNTTLRGRSGSCGATRS